MHIGTALRAGAFAACSLVFVAAAPAAVLYQFTTADANLNPDDGYDPAVVTITAAPVCSGPADGTAPVARSVDLSGVAFQGVDSVTFRYYPLTPANGNTMDFSGMSLTGVVVPEPATLGVAVLGGLGMLRRRRRVS